MKFMIIVKATQDSEAGVMPEDELITEMADYHEELLEAGAFLDGSGLRPSSQGWRIEYSGDRRTFVDGPFAETKELIAGYTIIDVASREEAIEWTMRFPNPAGPGREAQIEVRPYFELEDFEPGEGVERFRRIEARMEGGATGPLAATDAVANVAVRDLEAAREFYQGTLGLEPADTVSGEVIVFKSGSTKINVYRSQYAGTNQATAVTWVVGEEVDEVVRQLKARGVTFEHYDLPGATREGDVHVGGGMRAAWFKDPDGNILNVVNG